MVTFFAGSAWSAASASATTHKKPCIGLVLGGGGARGAAHIGVLKVLERERIPICAIAGTSVGSIVGSLYAVGYTPDQIEAIVTGIDWKDMFDDEPVRARLPMRRKDEDYRYLLDFKLGYRDGRILIPRGAIQGQKLLLLLRRLLLPSWPVTQFNELPIPFACVGTDIGNGSGVVYGKGDLAAAVRASMSVPGAFAPIRLDDKLMVDGGIFNNVPIDVVRSMGATRVIVVDVSSPLAPEESLGSSFAIARQMLDMLMQQRTAAMLATMQDGDVLIKPRLTTVSAAGFDRVADAIADGEAAANDQVDALDALALGDADYTAVVDARRKLDFDLPLIEFVEIATHRSRSSRLVAEQIRQPRDQPLDLNRLEDDIGLAFGRGGYERISWSVREADGQQGLQVLPVDKGWGPNFITFGLQLSDDFRGNTNYSVALEATATGINARGGEWRNRIETGKYTGIRTEFYQPWGRLARWYVLPYVDYVAFNQTLRPINDVFATYRLTRGEHGVSVGFNPAPALRFEFGSAFGRDRANLRFSRGAEFDDIESDFAATYAGVTYDTIDNVDFPADGTRFALDATFYDDAFGGDASGEKLNLAFDHAIRLKRRHHLLFGVRGSLSGGDDDLFQRLGLLGGFLNLSGFPDQELAGTQMAHARVVYYRRFGDLARLFSLPAYIGGSLEAGNVWFERRDMSFDSLIVAGSAFLAVDTPLGPFFLAYGRAERGEDSFYLSFEKMLRPFGRRR
jgi:NTE family protein